MFQEICYVDLQPGVKYKIMNFPNKYEKYYTGIFLHHVECHSIHVSQYFENVYEHPRHCHTSNFTCTNKYYYEFISQKKQIQQAMEHRALNKILKRLVNEEFTW
jgi:hypothetical protein